MRARILCCCLALAFAAPLHAQSSRADADAAPAVHAAELQVSPALRPAAFDARLLAPASGDARQTGEGRRIPWPDDPGLQAVAAAGIGCVALGLTFLIFQGSGGDNFWWGCLFGGFIASGAASGWKLPDGNHHAPLQRRPGT